MKDCRNYLRNAIYFSYCLNFIAASASVEVKVIIFYFNFNRCISTTTQTWLYENFCIFMNSMMYMYTIALSCHGNIIKDMMLSLLYCIIHHNSYFISVIFQQYLLFFTLFAKWIVWEEIPFHFQLWQLIINLMTNFTWDNPLVSNHCNLEKDHIKAWRIFFVISFISVSKFLKILYFQLKA